MSDPKEATSKLILMSSSTVVTLKTCVFLCFPLTVRPGHIQHGQFLNSSLGAHWLAGAPSVVSSQLHCPHIILISSEPKRSWSEFCVTIWPLAAFLFCCGRALKLAHKGQPGHVATPVSRGLVHHFQPASQKKHHVCAALRNKK